MKEKLKKFWKQVKNFLSFSMDFIFIVIVLFLVPFSLDILFETYPAIKTMFGDSNTGEILTYLSTTFLAFMALYQNNRFRVLNRKHEQEQKAKDAEVQKLLADKDAEMQEKMAAQNKEAQDRMAELTNRANELALKSQIINVETKRISELKILLEEFSKKCSFTNITNIYNTSQEELKKNKNDESISKDFLIKLEQLYLKVISELRNEKAVDVESLIKTTTDLYKIGRKYLTELNCCFISISYSDYGQNTQDDATKAYCALRENFSNIAFNFENLKNSYVEEIDKIYHKLVYTYLSIEEINSMFSFDNHKI